MCFDKWRCGLVISGPSACFPTLELTDSQGPESKVFSRELFRDYAEFIQIIYRERMLDTHSSNIVNC